MELGGRKFQSTSMEKPLSPVDGDIWKRLLPAADVFFKIIFIISILTLNKSKTFQVVKNKMKLHLKYKDQCYKAKKENKKKTKQNCAKHKQ